MTYKTYRNYHSEELHAVACANDEQKRGDPHGGWWRICTPEEERACEEQERVSRGHDSSAIWALATRD
jgi:hypothetical protein